MDKLGISHARNAEVRAWMKKETAAQKKRYQLIVKEQDDLAPKRDKWIADFLQRIQTRGFNVDADMMRIIKPEEIPTRPKRKFKVVF